MPALCFFCSIIAKIAKARYNSDARIQKLRNGVVCPIAWAPTELTPTGELIDAKVGRQSGSRRKFGRAFRQRCARCFVGSEDTELLIFRLALVRNNGCDGCNQLENIDLIGSGT